MICLYLHSLSISFLLEAEIVFLKILEYERTSMGLAAPAGAVGAVVEKRKNIHYS